MDGSGNIYVTGSSPTTWGSPVRSYSNGTDAFVAKMDSSGNLLWNTYLGGSGEDYGTGITLDGSGNIYVVGNTHTAWSCSPAPCTVRGYTSGVNAFAAKLDSSGDLLWNTFLGGDWDYGKGIAVDGSGNVYVSGESHATWGCSPMSCTVRGYTKLSDAFAAKLDSSGNLLWNTFLGGSGYDDGWGIAVDGSGNVYVTGSSSAAWSCSPASCTLRAYTSGYDSFAAKFNSSGSLIWNAFQGGDGSDGYDVAVDGSGNIYLAGDSEDAFVTKMDPSGNLLWNTFVYGSGYGTAFRSIAVDGSGNVYVAGESTGTWGCSTNPCTLRGYAGGRQDAFAAKVNSSGKLLWNTFLGGSGWDSGWGIAVDGSGNVYVAGSSDATWGSPVRDYSGGWQDAIVVKLPPPADLIAPSGNIGTNYNPTFTWNQVTGSTRYYLWVNGPSGNMTKQWYTSAEANCDGTTCSVTPSTILGG